MEQFGETGYPRDNESLPGTSTLAEKNETGDTLLDAQIKARRPVNPSVARRPFTRSQTSGNRVTRNADTGAQAAVQVGKEAASKRTLDQVESDGAEMSSSKSPNAPADMPSAIFDPLDMPSSLPGQYTFLAASPSTPVYERRGPRTRTAQPVPVPNLTKKSRGRRVPTKTVVDEEIASPKEGRVYVCKVEDCGKCFNRGEHLKRHVRSIHTHEKPFQCSHPDCDKLFNRHDNLLQHQKVHKDFSSASNAKNISHSPPRQVRQSPQPPMTHHEHIFRSSPRTSVVVPLSYATFSSYQQGPTSPLHGFTTNMAVSSLRTELPNSLDSPTNGDARYYPGFDPEPPLAQHTPFTPNPAQLLPSQHPVDADQRVASSIFY